MYVIKHFPEDFVVEEVRELKTLPEGEHAIYEMKKKNYSTVQAIQRLAVKLKKPLKDFGFAGNKDRKAVTKQYISVWKAPDSLDNLRVENISLSFKGFKKKRISLGDLDGNAFTLTIRNLSDEEVGKAKEFAENPFSIPNLFGSQRFGFHNYEVGKLLLKKKFKEAVSLVVKYQGEYEKIVQKYADKHETDHIGALRKVPRYIKGYFISSFQALLFNKMVNILLQDKAGWKEDSELPLLGFGTDMDELQEKIKDVVHHLLKEEGITLRDFIIPQFPELSLEGSSRKLFLTPQQFTIKGIEEDDQFKEKKKMILSFTLEKSCYATTLLSFVFQDREDALHHTLKGLVRINTP